MLITIETNIAAIHLFPKTDDVMTSFLSPGYNCPPSWSLFGDKCYKMYDNMQYNMWQSKELCEHDGTLTSLHTGNATSIVSSLW